MATDYPIRTVRGRKSDVTHTAKTYRAQAKTRCGVQISQYVDVTGAPVSCLRCNPSR